MQKVISKILKEMAEYDQLQRKNIIKRYGSLREKSINEHPFYELKGACIQRFRIVRLLVKHNLLKTANDYCYASNVLRNSSRKKDHFISLWLASKVKRLGKERKIMFFDKYYGLRGWDREQIKKEYKMWLKERNKK